MSIEQANAEVNTWLSLSDKKDITVWKGKSSCAVYHNAEGYCHKVSKKIADMFIDIKGLVVVWEEKNGKAYD
jgi:hypothetical protein